MAKYKVKDSQTGKTITFDWSGEKPPSEADLTDIFSTAQGGQEKTLAPTASAIPATPAPDKSSNIPIVSDVAQGAISTAGSTTFGLGWLTGSEGVMSIGENIRKLSEQYGSQDPGFKEELAAGFGSAGVYFLPGIGISYATAPLGPIGNLLGVGVSTVMESMSEAGDVYSEMLKAGKSEEEANSAASKTFLANAALIGITNKLGMFSETGGIVKKALKSAPMEGGQESGQTMISNYFQGKPQDAGEIATSGIIGAIIGGVFGGATGVSSESIKNISTDIKKKLRSGQSVESEIAKLEAFFQSPATEAGASTPPPMPRLTPPPIPSTIDKSSKPPIAVEPPATPEAPAPVIVTKPTAVSTATQEAPARPRATSKAKLIRKDSRGVVATIKPEVVEVIPTTPIQQVQEAEAKTDEVTLETLMKNQDRIDNLVPQVYIPDRRTDVATAEQIDAIHVKARDQGLTSLTDEEVSMYDKYTERKAIERTIMKAAEMNAAILERKAKNKARPKETTNDKVVEVKSNKEQLDEIRKAEPVQLEEPAQAVETKKEAVSNQKGKEKLAAKTEEGLQKVIDKLTKDVETLIAKKNPTEADRMNLDKIETKLVQHEEALYKLKPELRPAAPDADAIVAALKPKKEKINPVKAQKEINKVGLEVEALIEERSHVSLNSPQYVELSDKLKMLEAYETKLNEAIGSPSNQDIKDILASDTISEEPIFDRLERATVDSTTPKEVIVKEAQETDTLNPDEIRKGTKAYQFADGYIITGNSFADMTGQLIAELSAHGGRSEQGYVDKDGNFISETLLKKRNEPGDSRKKKARNIIKALAILRNQKGFIGFEIGELNTETVKRIADLRDKFKAIEADAKRANVEIETYLRKAGMSEEVIESYRHLKAAPIQGGEVIKNITLEQKKNIFELTNGSGSDVKAAIEALGINKNLDNLSFVEGEQVAAYLSTDGSIDSIMMRLQYQPVGILSRVNTKLGNLKDKTIRHWASPEVGFRKEKASAQMYKAVDRADINKHRFIGYIEYDKAFDIVKVNKFIPEDSEASRKVALALENKITLDKLTPKEKAAFEAHKKFYSYAVDFFVKEKTASPEEEAIVRKLAPTIKYNVKEDTKAIATKLRAFRKEYKISRDGMKALDLLRMREVHYLPHIFERDSLIQTATTMLKEMQDRGSTNKEAMKALEKLISTKSGGQLLLNSIPKSVIFNHLKRRGGTTGYKVDAHIAFNSYLRGFLKEIYDAPMLKQYETLRSQMSPDMQKHADRFIQDYMGRTEYSQVAQFIRQMEWMRTLGFSPRSAMTNAIGGTLNTSIEGGHFIVPGFLRAITREGIQETREAGIPSEIPQVDISMDEAAYHSKTEKLRYYTGWMFNKVELGLRNVAYHTGKAKGESLGLTGEDLFFYSMDFVHKTQYRYGRVGMPIGMRGWSGALTQFASYPVKTFELMHSWMFREGMAGKIKLLSFIMAAEGGEWATREFLGLDLSSALGFGVRLGDVWTALESASEGEWENATKNWKLAWGGGSGLFPENILPVGPAWNLINSFTQQSDDRINEITKELSPLQAIKVRNLFYALKYQKEGRFPVFKYDGTFSPIEKKYELNLKDTLLSAFGPKPNSLSELQRDEYKNYLNEKTVSEILTKFNRALANGNVKEVERLFSHYPGVVGLQKDIGGGASNERMKMELTAEQRRQLEGFGNIDIQKLSLEK